MKKISYVIGILCLLLLFTSCKAEKKVTAKYYSGEETISEKYDSDTLLTEDMFPNMEADKGYQIEKWYLDQDYKTLVVFPYQLKEDTHFYLKWVPINTQNKVTIYLHNGDQTEEKSIDINTTLNETQAEKLGYKFKGWSTDKDTYTPFDFTSVVTKDTHLYAFFDINTYTITFYDGEKVYHTESVDYNKVISKPENPSSDFIGWSTNKDVFEEYDFNNTVSKEFSLYAFYSNKCKVTFYNDEDIYEYKSYDFNQTIAKPENPSKDGYTFKGWSTDKDTYTEYNFTKPVSKDINLYAFYDINQYKVTFYNGEDVYEYKSYDFNQTITKPENPSKDGYTFKGWSTNKNSYVAYDFTKPVETTLTLYAYFEINTYTISFDVDGTVTTSTVDYLGTVTKPTDPSKTGYTFKGWSTDKDTYTEYLFSNIVSKNINLYAFFDINQYKVTFYNGEDVYEYKSYDFNQTITKPENPSKDGHTFKGWSTDKDTYTEYNFTNTISKDINLYAFYDINQCEIKYYVDDTLYKTQKVNYNTTTKAPENPTDATLEFEGWYLEKDFKTKFNFDNPVKNSFNLYANMLDPSIPTVKVDLIIDDKTTSQTIELNSTLQQPENPSKDGYTFKGWSTNKNSYVAYDFTKPVETTLTLYAYFEINTYTISFDVDGTVTTATVDYLGTVTKPTDPSKTGYTFKGWSTKKDMYIAYDFAKAIETNLTLFAYFEINTYTITFDVDGSVTTTSVDYLNTVTKPTDPSKTGYSFKGWYYNNQEFNFSTPITDSITLVAKFEINTYTISFDVDGSVTTTSVDYLGTVTKPTDPSKTGYTFKGWSTNKNSYVAYDFTKPVQTEFTLYAFFDINTYTITFDVDGTVTTATVDYLGTVTKPTDPSKTGYTFKGWSTNKNSYVAYDFTKPVQTEFTLFAYFEINTYTITFDVDGTKTTSTVDYLGTVTKPADPSKTGYTFKGWSTNKNSYVAYDFTKPVQTEFTLFAYFEINTYTITFDVDGTKTTSTIDYLGTVTKPADPSKTGYTFKGWYYNNQEFNFSTPITDSITLVAKFEKIVTYTVTFKNGSTTTTQPVEKGKLVTKPEDPIKDGYSFIGWYEDDVKFDFTTAIECDIILEAHFEESVLNITSSGGYTEGLYIEFDKLNGLNLANYTISYKLSSDASFKNVDSQLIREKGNTIRCDIVGLTAGDYDVKINAGTKSMSKSFTVTADDRSGYAHFGNTTGVGAYNNDGTLKSNAVVVYVSDETKNTVTAQIGGKTYTGLVAIIKACTKSSYALDIRILGEIQTTQWNFKEHGTGNTSTRQQNLENTFNYVNDPSNWDEKSSSNYSKLNAEDIISKGINSMSNDIAKGITKLEGLTNQVLRNKKADSKTGAFEYDSYYNMLDVAGAYNITIEGIGTDAAIFQWGFAFKKCNSIEIKNIRFYNYTEDAVGFEGASNTDTNYGYYWVHNCTFDLGVNNWDVCYENDKKDGDGSTDVKYCHNVTISYVQYNKTHKTNLIGSSDSALQYNITLHHNYYNNCGSRLPLVRQTNIHMYNNYYYKSSSYSNSIRANCYALVENCYYEGGKNPYETQSNGAIKAYNNIYTSDVQISGSSYKKENTVTSRTQTVSNTCKPDGSTDYSDFDMNPNLFYYDATNKVSKVKNMLAPEDVPAHCKTYSGTLKANAKGLPDSSGGGSTVTPIDPDPITPTGDKVVLCFNDFATASISSATTVNGITILPKSGKTAEIKALKSSQTIAGTSVSKYIAFGGAGSFNDLSVKFTTTKKANITVYYESPTAGRYAQLCSDSTSTKAGTATVSGEVVSYTFTNQEASTYSVCSSNSSLNIYLIVIEYVE